MVSIDVGALDTVGPSPSDGTVVVTLDGALETVGSGNVVGPPTAEGDIVVDDGSLEAVGSCAEGIRVLPPVLGTAVTPDGALDAVGPASDGTSVSTDEGAGAVESTVGTRFPVEGRLVALVGSLDGVPGTIVVGTAMVGIIGAVPRLGKLVVKRDGSGLGAGGGTVGAGLIVISISSGGKSCR